MSELYLPSSLVDELAEERAASVRAPSERTVDTPVWFGTRNSGVTFLGPRPEAAQLLDEQRGWAQIALRAIMDRVKGIEWFVGEKVFDADTGRFKTDPLPQHPANILLERPNPIYSGQMLKMLISGLVAQTGACYLQKIYDGLGAPVQLWPIPTQFIEPIAGNGRLIDGYQVQTFDGAQVILPLDDVVRVWRPDLRSLIGELGFLGPQAVEYDAQKSYNEQKRAYFDRDATPRTALLAESDSMPPDEAQTKRFNASWRQAYDRRRGTSSGLPAFIPPGFGVHEFSEPNNSQDVELDASWTKQIMAAYGVPLFAVGIDTNVNRATGETTMWAWDQNMIEPMTDLIADAYTTQLMQIDFGPSFVVEFEDFVAPDKEFELAQEHQRLADGVTTVNEIRSREGADEVSWGDLPRGTIADTPYTGEESAGLSEPVPLRAGGVLPSSCHVTASPARTSYTREDVWDPEVVWARNEALETRATPQWAAQQIKVWKAQNDLTLQRYAKAAGVDISDLREMGRKRRYGRLMEQLDQIEFSRSITVEQIFGIASRESVMLFEELIGPLRTGVYSASAEFAFTEAGGLTEFFLSPAMDREIESLGAASVTNIDTTTREHIRRELTIGNQAGDSVGQIARRITSVFRDPKRAETVARTEIGISNQAATMTGLQSSGVVHKKVWNTSRDGNVRDSHRIDGQVVAMDRLFTLLDGDQGAHPLDRRLQVGNIVNCRCFVTPVIEGVVDTSDPDQTNEG